MDLGIAGRSALVCGGSSGLGKAIAAALAQEGVAVTIVARDETKLAAAAAEIEHQSGSSVNWLSVDMSDAKARAELVPQCRPGSLQCKSASRQRSRPRSISPLRRTGNGSTLRRPVRSSLLLIRAAAGFPATHR